MRLRIEVTAGDITKAKTHWRYDSPIYHAIIRQTGCPNVEVDRSRLIVHWGRSRYRVRGMDYALPVEVQQRLEQYYQSDAGQRHMEPFTFELELDRRGGETPWLALSLLALWRLPARTGQRSLPGVSGVPGDHK